MTTDTIPMTDPPAARIRPVATDRPWIWLTAGWRDMVATKPIALAYGGAVCLAGWVVSLLLFEAGTLWAILPATSGFFLVGPLVAAGLYEASRLREHRTTESHTATPPVTHGRRDRLRLPRLRRQ